MNILIITGSGDLHSHCISWLLRQRGHQVDHWVSTDYPHQQTIHFEINGEGLGYRVFDAAGELSPGAYDRVWSRRLPSLHPSNELHLADQDLALQQSTRVRDAVLGHIASDAFWVNPWPASSYGENKLHQLNLAHKSGLRLPQTMVTNDPGEVRALFKRCEGQLIYKTLRPMGWQDNENERAVYTTSLEWDDLQDDDALRLCPGIYQENIQKAFEVRANFMGNAVAAIAIDSQSRSETSQDWRFQNFMDERLPLTPIDIPHSVHKACRQLMDKMGIVFGAFDFIVTPGGDWVFLEVNPMGQFLWVEGDHYNFPDDDIIVPMTQMFVDFLESGDENFIWEGTPDPEQSLRAYFQSDAFKAFEEDPNQHHIPATRPQIPDYEQEEDVKVPAQ